MDQTQSRIREQRFIRRLVALIALLFMAVLLRDMHTLASTLIGLRDGQLKAAELNVSTGRLDYLPIASRRTGVIHVVAGDGSFTSVACPSRLQPEGRICTLDRARWEGMHGSVESLSTPGLRDDGQQPLKIAVADQPVYSISRTRLHEMLIYQAWRSGLGSIVILGSSVAFFVYLHQRAGRVE